MSRPVFVFSSKKSEKNMMRLFVFCGMSRLFSPIPRYSFGVSFCSFFGVFAECLDYFARFWSLFFSFFWLDFIAFVGIYRARVILSPIFDRPMGVRFAGCLVRFSFFRLKFSRFCVMSRPVFVFLRRAGPWDAYLFAGCLVRFGCFMLSYFLSLFYVFAGCLVCFACFVRFCSYKIA